MREPPACGIGDRICGMGFPGIWNLESGIRNRSTVAAESGFGSGIWNLESGIRNLDSDLEFGIWNPESGFGSGIWYLEFGIWNLESGIWNLESGICQRSRPRRVRR